jgi:ABC-type molybdate transport system substrate-binding protein
MGVVDIMLDRRLVVVATTLGLLATPVTASEAVLLHAAGSLRGALTEVAQGFEKASHLKVQAKFGASGLLKDEIAAGAKAEVFASANMEHPQALTTAGESGPVVLFARNSLCALARPAFTQHALPDHPGGAEHDDFHAGVSCAHALKNASRSALIVAASVVGMPCGKPL